MPYLLDGNNLIGLVRRTARPSDEDRQALVAELAERLRATRARAVLFFDGPAGERGSNLGSLSVRPGSAGSADEAILAEIRKTASPSECIVVTADRGLSGRVRDLGAKVCSPSDFFARFGSGSPSAGKEGGTARVDVDDWLRWFGDEGNRDSNR